MYIIIIGGSMKYIFSILTLITYLIMWCSIKVSSQYNEIENNISKKN